MVTVRIRVFFESLLSFYGRIFWWLPAIALALFWLGDHAGIKTKTIATAVGVAYIGPFVIIAFALSVIAAILLPVEAFKMLARIIRRLKSKK